MIVTKNNQREKNMLIDAKDLIVGRMATVVAKKVLTGETVDIINCEQAVVSGRKQNVFARFRQKYSMGAPLVGPYISRQPDRLVRRMIRGMMHHREGRGKVAFKRVMCYIGVPPEFKGKKADTIKEAQVSKLPTLHYTYVKDISAFLGAKK